MNTDHYISLRKDVVMKKSFVYKAISSFITLTLAFGAMETPIGSYAAENAANIAAEANNQNANEYKADDFPKAEVECGKDNIVATVQGTAYYYDSQKLIDAVNAIRKEACDNKYKNPANGKEYKPEDYESIKIKWSADMEAIAYQRSVEASINKVKDTRPNGNKYNTLKTNNKISSDKELIGLSSAQDAECIIKSFEEMVKEKDKWNKDHNIKEAPNYAELINSDNKYLAAMAFKADGTNDSYKTVVFEFSSKDKLNEKSKSITGNKSVSVEMKKDNVTGLSYTGSKSFNMDTANQLYVNAKVAFKTKANDKEYTYNHECKILEGTTWSSENKDIADVNATGMLYAKNVGKAKITAKACSHKISFEVDINKVSMKNQIKVRNFKKSLQYDLGNEVRQPEAELYVEIAEPDPKNPAKNNITKKPLKENTDYTVKYENNKEVGTATVIYTGVGNYSGKLKKTFEITPINLKSANEHNQVSCETVSGNNIYRKGGCKPSLVVKYKNVLLVEGKDYKVKYKNSKKSNATAVVKGTGNYMKSFKHLYQVKPSSLDVVSMNCLDVVYKPNKKIKKYISKPVLTDVDKKKLKKGVDFDKNVEYTVSGNNGELIPFTGFSAVEPGTIIYAKVRGLGWYGNSEKTCSYRVVEKSIAKAKVRCNTANLTDKLTASDVKVTIKVDGEEIDLKPGVDYEIQSAEWNKKKTKLSVTVHGIGSYGLVKKAKIKAW